VSANSLPDAATGSDLVTNSLSGKLTFYEAFEGLELLVAMHNIGGLGIRRLLEGFHEEL
jgi:hypothetical protein